MQEIYQGDCLEVMRSLEDNSIDMTYLDPPFFSNKKHSLSSRDRKQNFSFNDIWDSHISYAEFMHARFLEIKRILKDTGSVFIHCDKSANHILRLIGEDVFGEENFLSEIIWSFKRWSNSANNLTPNHQNILFFSKTKKYHFNKIFTQYSETTNIDQILQKRSRDEHGKAIYARELDGSVISSDEKKGVPLSDVWEIPFLNPKAKERTGYPTQKPILLLERIIEISTKMGDIILDPFCGSGTTLVAAKLNGRKCVGIDLSQEAIDLTKLRLENLFKTHSQLLIKGRSSYINANERSMAILSGIDVIPVQRNSGIDAILRKNYLSKPVPIRVQRENETISEAINRLSTAASKKGAEIAFMVVTKPGEDYRNFINKSSIVKIIVSPAYEINAIMDSYEEKFN